MFASVAYEYGWPPDVLGGLFFDNQDIYGLEFWYKRIEEMDKKMKALKRK